MNRKLLTASAAAIGLITWATEAYSAPVYIGLQEAGVNGGAITQEATGNGTASITGLVYGNTTNGLFAITASVAGTPPNPEPMLLSNSTDVTGNFPGTISIYISETNQFPGSPGQPGFNVWESVFAVQSMIGVPGSPNANTTTPGITIVESTYFHECAIPNAACNTTVGGDVFATTSLLSQETFTSAGSKIDFTTNDLPISTGPYAITEEYTITFSNAYTEATDSIGVRVPEPAALALFGIGLLGLGVVRHRAKL